jgi:hypothetical protein
MSQQPKKIDFINIDCESNYFNTREQIEIRRNRSFLETTSPSRISGSNAVSGLMSRKRIVKDDLEYGHSLYLTSSTVTDASGNDRKILASSNDYLISGSIDSYKNGIEITQEKHWTAGVAKITAGTPGHLYDSQRYGYTDFDILSPDVYYEVETFNPVTFVEIGGSSNNIVYPIVTSNSNQEENLVLNGIIEPFPIRPVISNSSINFPFEPHATRGEFGNGNTTILLYSDQVLSVDYFEPSRTNKSPYFDAVDLIGMPDENGGGVIVGPSLGYASTGENGISFFEDARYTRGEKPNSSYTEDLISALEDLPPGGTTYVTSKERSATCGFTYDQAVKGTDSIAYGGYLRSESKKQNRSIIKARDERSFLSSGATFNDLSTVSFIAQSVEYPSMIPSSFLSSSITALSSSASEICRGGGIRVQRTTKPGLFDSALNDSIILTERDVNP